MLCFSRGIRETILKPLVTFSGAFGSLLGPRGCQQGLRESMGHEAREGCADIGGGDACERCHWGLGWSSRWGHEPCEGRAEMGMRWAGRTHVNCATGAFGGAPYGATNRVRGVPKCVAGYTIRTKTVGLSARD